MAIDFEKWNKDFGGEAALQAVKEASENTFAELPEGVYRDCKIEKLELAESSTHKPMVKAMFRITKGKFKKQCIFYNGVMAANDPSKSGYCIHNVLNFLRSLQIFDASEIDFSGDYSEFNELILDLAEESEYLRFTVKTEKDGDFNKITVTDAYEVE